MTTNIIPLPASGDSHALAVGTPTYDRMCAAIAEAAAVDEVAEMRDKAKALEHYMRRAKNTEAERAAITIRLRAERRAGELLSELERDPAHRPRKLPPGGEVISPLKAALSDANLSSQDASRFQTIARVPAEVFERKLAEPVKPTTRGLAALAAPIARSRTQNEVRLREHCSLEKWRTLDAATRAEVLSAEGVTPTSFIKQDNKNIEWAQWSWNPITGCEHTCSYCYAREIAENSPRSSAFPNGFAPTLKPRAILAPRIMKVPKAAETDTRYRNVFLGSMADIFGRWVPKEWIDAVLAECRAAPDWNFLCLTKFPKRMAQFDVPENVWMGTTVDLQARVKAAEDGFAKVNSKVRWLSCEPMLEPLVFQHLDRFNWIVIGGASRTSKTPQWAPPYAWIRDLEDQANRAGVKVYFKSNLFDGNARRLELPFDAPITPDPAEAPPVFHYLKQGKDPP